MLDSETWVVVDTETTGLRNPVYPVEIGAQLMRGWQREGDFFAVLLNFDVPIDPIAQKMHGYSREYLRDHGLPPKDALKRFSEYVGKSPIVTYNQAYDWSRVILPTFTALGIPLEIRPAFCALDLTRNVCPSLPDFKLKTVMKTFGLAKKQAHHATLDVGLVVRLLSEYVGPHLRQSGITGLQGVAACAAGMASVPPLVVPAQAKKTRVRKTRVDVDTAFAMGELVGICRAIVADKQFSACEINLLAHWLERCPYSGIPPISGIFKTVSQVIADAKVTVDEQRQLSEAIEDVIRWQLPES
jgi:DNA polymerase III epsilon subunit-like protein